jgi:dTDP-4-amino-4,6-dideoxygalactose transaminase
LALLVAGVKAGDEVITVSHSFIATANSIRYCGAVPVFVDIVPATFNMDPSQLAAAITEKTSAILCVHQMGMPCDIEAIVNIGKRHGIPIIEDAACAIGSELRSPQGWERIGKPHGDIACFSFHPRKVITTGEGGMLTCNNEALDHRFRMLRQHFMSVPDTKRHDSRQVLFESYPELGYNYRMTDIQAAIGLEQLKRLPDIIARRRDLASQYATLLSDIEGLGIPLESESSRSNWQSYCVVLPPKVDQRIVMQSMLDAGISTRRGIMCAHREGAYERELWRCRFRVNGCECTAGACRALVNSEVAQEQGMILPLYPQMTRDEQQLVVSTLKSGLRVGTAPTLASV